MTSLLYGVLMSAIALTSVPSWQSAGPARRSPEPTTVQAAPVPTPVPAPKVRPARLETGALTAYLAREWKLGREYAAQVATAVLFSSKRHRVDPVLLLAVAAAESSLQHSVGNPGGGVDPMKPFGIMQVAGQYHADKFPGGTVKVTSVSENFDIGARVLKEYLALERGNERRALLRYNGSLNISDRYFRKVSRFKERLGRALLAYQAREPERRPA
jgi:hypothetical protein